MFVKICGITSYEDALAAVEAGASALGFNFYERSPRYVAPELAGDIVAKLPQGPAYAGVFVNESPERAAAVLRIAGLGVAQFHGAQEPAGEGYPYRVWRAFGVTEEWDPLALREHRAEAFLLDAPANGQYGGTGKTFAWERARLTGERVILAGGLSAENVCEAIAAARPWGVDACSKLEASPGRKDRAKVRQFIRNAQVELL